MTLSFVFNFGQFCHFLGHFQALIADILVFWQSSNENEINLAPARISTEHLLHIRKKRKNLNGGEYQLFVTFLLTNHYPSDLK